VPLALKITGDEGGAVLLINNYEEEKLLSMAECIDALDSGYRQLAAGEAVYRPRIDVYANTTHPEGKFYRWGSMEGALADPPVFAIRTKSDLLYWVDRGDIHTEEKFCVRPGLFCGLIQLYSTANGEPLAILNDGFVQHARVAGTACLAAKYLARREASTLGILGSGGMARSHALGFCAIRGIKKINVYSPTPQNREKFAREIAKQTGVEVQAHNDPERVVESADILAACTDSVLPVIKKQQLRAGLHVSTVLPSELEHGIHKSFDVLIRHLDHRAQRYMMPKIEEEYRRLSKAKLSDFQYLYSDNPEMYPTLADLVAGRSPSRTNDSQITFFDNVPGSGIQFAAVANLIYEKAKQQGVGREIPTEWFLQDIRD
jgi:ornithine cyclodeaminase/alanine dehydrogenase-like protein (mu-crystallin family)